MTPNLDTLFSSIASSKSIDSVSEYSRAFWAEKALFKGPWLDSCVAQRNKDTVKFCALLVAEVPEHRQGQVTQSLIVCMSKKLFKHTNSWKCPALSCYPPCMKVTANLNSVGSDLLSRKNKDWMLPFILPDVFLSIWWTQMCIVTPCPRLAGIRSLWYAVMW